jgi:hypothetical protein
LAYVSEAKLYLKLIETGELHLISSPNDLFDKAPRPPVCLEQGLDFTAQFLPARTDLVEETGPLTGVQL